MRKPVIYIAAPYTNPDPVENTHKAIKIATELYDEGWCVPFVPHLTMLWHLVTPRPVKFWLTLDIEHMENCDAVWRLPGQSSGADGEERHAIEVGIPVFHNYDDLKAWAMNRVMVLAGGLCEGQGDCDCVCHTGVSS